MNVERIYVAIDFKSDTNLLLSYAVWLSQTFDCKSLCLFNIMEYTLTPPAYLTPYINKEKKKIQEKLNTLAAHIAQYIPNIDNKVGFGRLIESIKQIIKDDKSFLVMGFKTHITRPSTSERILKALKLPILVVKGDDFKQIKPEDIKIKKILCAVDFSEYSLKALNVAQEIAKKWDSELKVLHVIPEQKIRGILDDEKEIERYINYLKEETQARFQKIDTTLNYEIISGIPHDEIVKKTVDADIVVIGSKGRSYTEAIIIGSVAEVVIKNSQKPVLLIH